MPCFVLESEIDSGGVRARVLKDQYAEQLSKVQGQFVKAIVPPTPLPQKRKHDKVRLA